VNRATRLKPGKPPRRKGWMARGNVPIRAVSARRAREAQGRKPKIAARSKGPSRKVRKLVLDRDGRACVCCGISIIGRRYSLGHRLRASQGGKAVPSNLLIFLGWGGEGCHGRIDNRDDPHDEAKGYTVRSGQDPAQVGVMIFSEHGSGVTKYPWDDGQYHDEPPELMAA
jgi:hypothetical protein